MARTHRRKLYFFWLSVIALILISTDSSLRSRINTTSNNTISQQVSKPPNTSQSTPTTSLPSNAGATQPPKMIVNVRNFGAVGDGKTDDTEAIQKAINDVENDGGGEVYIPDGVYAVNVDKSIWLASNVHLKLSSQAVLKAMPNSKAVYHIVNVEMVHNVTISGGIIEGDKYTHLGKKGEWGMGIAVEDSSNVVIRDLSVKDCWGDGIYIAPNGKPDDHVLVTNVIASNNRRNGMSVISGRNVTIENSTVEQNGGTSPQAGIDIEPDNTSCILDNIRVSNIQSIKNRGQGLQIGLVALKQSSSPLSVYVNGYHDVGSQIGLFISTSRKMGQIVITHSSWKDNSIQAVRQLNRTSYIDDSFLPIHTSVTFMRNAEETPISIQTNSLGSGEQGAWFTTMLSAKGGAPPYRWGVNAELPKGFSLSPTGRLSGLPPEAGTYKFNVVLYDNEYNRRSKQLTLQVVS